MKLFVKMIEPETFYSMDIELMVTKYKKNVRIDCLNIEKPKILLYPIYTNFGIKLEKIIFPIVGKMRNEKYLFYFNYVLKMINIKKNHEIYPNHFLSVIMSNYDLSTDINDYNYYQQDIVEDLKLFEREEFLLNEFMLTIFQLPLKLKNLLIHTKNIPNSLIELLNMSNEIMYNGQYFDNLNDLINLKTNNKEYKYLNKIKSINGDELFFIENNELNINNCIMDNDYYSLVAEYVNILLIKNDKKLNNLVKIVINFYENKLSEFQLLLFIISNNINFSSNNNYFTKILQQAKKILEIKDFVDLSQVEYHDILNLKLFLDKYTKFKDLLYKRNIPNIYFTLNYNKKKLDDNILKLIYLKINFNEISKYFKNKIKYQMETLFNDKINLSNDKAYRDYTIRLYYKLNMNEENLDSFNKYNFFRNIFYDIKWLDIVNNFELINMICNNSHILLYYGKLNNVIFENLNFKNFQDILKNKFKIIPFLNSQARIYDFLMFNYSDLELILDDFINLSKNQVRNLSKIIYLTTFLKDNYYESDNYNDFIRLCSKNNFILSKSKFNLKIKEYLNLTDINYGRIVRDIMNFNEKNNNKLSPFEENLKLKKLVLKYKTKYSKYKAKYCLEKEKNNPNYTEKKIHILEAKKKFKL